MNDWEFVNDREFALEWYRYGLDKDEEILKFVAHWIAFNWMYRECRKGDDRRNIEAFCEREYERLRNFNAFGTGDILVFEDGPVRDETSGHKRKREYTLLMEGTEREAITALLLSIYQVRCNLFHGSKSLRVDRDIELVRSSSRILAGYLKALLIDDSIR